MADISPEGDAARQAEIDALPESLETTVSDLDTPDRLEADMIEETECGDCGSQRALTCSCGAGFCSACAIIGGDTTLEALNRENSFRVGHRH